MTDLNIEKFNPTVSELKALVEDSKDLSIKDYKDDEGLLIIKEHRLKLRDARTTITKTGKELRSEAVSFQKAVIAKEKELLEIITPREDELKLIEDTASLELQREKRLIGLPDKKEKLLKIGVEVEDNILLDMDSSQFDSFLNEKTFEHNEKKAEEIRIKEEEISKKEREQELITKAREEEKERIENEKKVEESKKIIEENELKENTEYVEWLKDNGYTEETKDTFKIVSSSEVVHLYKLVNTYNK